MNIKAILLVIGAAGRLVKASGFDKLVARKMAEMQYRMKNPPPADCEGLARENDELVRALAELKAHNDELVAASAALADKYLRLKRLFIAAALLAAVAGAYLVYRVN
ncbi:MAG TPA: hypothetical protein VJM83_01870 [Nitrospirota bacterium]|nr:hypothetical protein [Nitrospirota bacterium]